MSALVGIVVVSHSAELAHGLAAMLGQVGSGRVSVVAAGGSDVGGLGTSYERVWEALVQADGGAGVVVLADVGSSVLTSRMVLEDEPVAQGLLADAPLVEGAVAAVTIAAAGADLAAVAAAAEEAREFRKL